MVATKTPLQRITDSVQDAPKPDVENYEGEPSEEGKEPDLEAARILHKANAKQTLDLLLDVQELRRRIAASRES